MSTDLTNHPAVELVATATLKANLKNARTHSAKQTTQLANIIRRFGFLAPIVVDDQNRIAAGHNRWAAAKQLKMAEVPVIRAAFLSDADFQAFALADNRIAELAGWDEDILAAELKNLFEDGYDLDITGFSTADLDLTITEVDRKPKAERVDLPDPAATAVSRLGDLWHVGPHRLYCGDARKVESYEAVLGGEAAAMIFSDPPYGVPIDGHVSGLGAVRHREFQMMSGEQTPAELTAFFRAVFRLCVRFAQPGSIHYHCIDWRHVREMIDAGDGVYAELKQLVVWDKQSGGMGSFYRSQHEFILAFKAGRARHTNNFGLGASRYRTNIWSMPGANSFRKGRAQDLADHPTVKPTALVADAMLDCSNRGDLVLDPFSGSGTTLLAAHRTGRRGAAIEIDPLYVDTGIRRLTATSSLEARLADGRSFEQVRAARAAETVDG